MRPVPKVEIEQFQFWGIGQRIADRAFDCPVGDVKLADAIPLRRVGADALLRGGGSCGPHRGEPVAVARNDGILGVELLDQRAREFGAAASFGQAEERPCPLAETFPPVRPRPAA